MQNSNCAYCFKDKACKIKDGRFLSNCPTINNKELTEFAKQEYEKKENRDFMLNSLRQVADGYCVDENNKPLPSKTRLEEIIEFCKRMNYKKLGLAFCTALEDDAKIFAEVLRKENFEVVSAVCKIGGLEKEEIGLENDGKIVPGRREITCNPLEQAEIMNRAKTDFNIVFGLCLGHDSLFLKASDALCTVFVVKDRVLKHNPILALK